MHERNRQVVGKPRNRKRSAGKAALDRAREGFRLRRHHSTVCVLSNHPVVLEQLEQAIDKSRFRVLTERLKSFGSALDDTLAVPNAPFYVLDALGPRPATAAIIQRVLQTCPDSRVLLIAEDDAEGDCFELLLLGARGLLTYGEAADQLTDALTCVADGGFWLTPLRLSRFVDSFFGRYLRKQPAVSALSRRENEIVQKLFRNYSNKEIANELNISERTVKFHVSNLLQKFGVRGRMELVLSYGPPAPTNLLGPHTSTTQEHPAKNEHEDILPVSYRPAYSVS